MLFTLNMVEMNLIYFHNPGTRLGLIAALKDVANKLPAEKVKWRAAVLALVDRMDAMSDKDFVKVKLHNFRAEASS